MEKSMYYKILEEIRDLKSMVHGKLSERWLTITDVTHYTSLSDSTIRRAVRRCELKCSTRIYVGFVSIVWIVVFILGGSAFACKLLVFASLSP